MNIINFRKLVTVVPTISTDIYASGDQLGEASIRLADVLRGPKDITLLQEIVVIDADNQKAAIDFLFWNTKPTGVSSANNAAFTITAADLKARFCASLSIGTGDYLSTAAQAAGTKIPAFPVTVQSLQNTNNPTGKDLYMSMIVRGTPTYTTTSSLQITLKFQ